MTAASPGDEELIERLNYGVPTKVVEETMAEAAARLRSLAEELKIQDDANDILTRRIAELEAENERQKTCLKVFAGTSADLTIENGKLSRLEEGYLSELSDYAKTVEALRQRIAALEAAAHVRITSLEKNLDAWKSTAFNRYNEIEQQKARIVELEAACARKGNELCVQSQELARLEAGRTEADKEVYARVEHWRSSVEALQDDNAALGKALRKCQTFTPSLMDGEEAKERLKEINRYVYSVLGTGDTK